VSYVVSDVAPIGASAPLLDADKHVAMVSVVGVAIRRVEFSKSGRHGRFGRRDTPVPDGLGVVAGGRKRTSFAIAARRERPK
jgi:hypothetical protein